MTIVMVDIEADGPIPGDYSMVCFGAVIVEPSLSHTFYGQIKPISDKWIGEALAVSGFTREETLKFDEPVDVMHEFKDWCLTHKQGPLKFWADNNGFDYMFTHWYFEHFVGFRKDPFGHSSENLNSWYKGCVRDSTKNMKRLRKTRHTHNPVDDAMGNAEALLKMKEMFNLKLNLDFKK